MLEVAPPLALGGWDMRIDEIWPSTSFGPGRCVPVDLYASQPMQYVDLQPQPITIAPRTLDAYNVSNAIRVRSPVRLSVQPTKVKPRQRRRSTPRKTDHSHSTNSLVARHDSDRIEISQLPGPAECPPPSQKLLALTPTASGTNRFADTLFSLIASDRRPYDPTNRCDLCRQPFETEERALYAHLSRHFRELEGSFSCKKCQITFSHDGDLKWHQRFSEDEDCAQRPAAGWQSRERLTHWEQAQLQLHSRTIDSLCHTRSNRTRLRPSSLPPRKRRPLSVTIDNDTDRRLVRNPASRTRVITGETHSNKINKSDHMPVQVAQLDSVDTSYCRSKTVTPQVDCCQHSDANLHEQTYSNTGRAMHSLQQRILDLMETIQSDLTENDDRPTPYSDFCDSHSLPGTPENHQRSQPFERDDRVDRATSEPPLRTQGAEDYSKRAAPDNGDPARGHTSGSLNLGTSNTGHGQKRVNDGNDPNQWERDDADGPLKPKKRKTISASTNTNEKRFPCIFHVGEPERFAKDLARHKHISNMVRHLKSHDFYTCSTCIVRLSKHEDLDVHSGQHTKACSKKGCKRTRPAGQYLESVDCAHIMDGEDQWKALFVLQFNRDAPNIFNIELQECCDSIDTTYVAQGVSNTNELAIQPPIDMVNDPSGIYGLTDSFFDQAMDFDLGLPGDNIQSATPLLDMNDFLVPEPVPSVKEANTNEASATPAAGNMQASRNGENVDIPMESGFVTLEQKVTALEGILSAQTSKDKDRIFSLQEKVVQLEQKLFQSSEREQQLEATLGVIFDALQRTGDSRAQPNKALWNLVMSHSSQAIGSVSGTFERVEEKREKPSPHGFLPVSPSLTFKTSVQTPPDSAYGSIR